MIFAEASTTDVPGDKRGEGDVVTSDVDGVVVFELDCRCPGGESGFDRELSCHQFADILRFNQIRPDFFLCQETELFDLVIGVDVLDNRLDLREDCGVHSDRVIYFGILHPFQNGDSVDDKRAGRFVVPIPWKETNRWREGIAFTP